MLGQLLEVLELPDNRSSSTDSRSILCRERLGTFRPLIRVCRCTEHDTVSWQSTLVFNHGHGKINFGRSKKTTNSTSARQKQTNDPHNSPWMPPEHSSCDSRDIDTVQPRLRRSRMLHAPSCNTTQTRLEFQQQHFPTLSCTKKNLLCDLLDRH